MRITERIVIEMSTGILILFIFIFVELRFYSSIFPYFLKDLFSPNNELKVQP